MKPKYWLWLILAIALLIRLPGLDGPTWYDENYSLLTAGQNWTNLYLSTAGDVHPPGYYVLLKLWMMLTGGTVVAARMLSALLSLASVGVFYLTLEEWADSNGERLTLTALYAINGFGLYFANEIRMYSLLGLLVLLGVWLIHQERWGYMIAIVPALCLTHNYGLFYTAVLGVYALWRSWPNYREIVKPFAWGGIIWLSTWGWVLSKQMFAFSAGSGHWIDAPSVAAVMQTLGMLLFGVLTGRMAISATIATGGMVAFMALGWRELDKKLLWLALGPLAIAVVVSYLIVPVYLYRALIGLLPFLLVVVYKPLLGRLTTSRSVLMAVLFLAPVIGAGVIGYYTDRENARILLTPALADIPIDPEHDIIYSTTDGPHVDIAQNRPDLRVYQMPECEGTNDQGALTAQTRAALGLEMAELADLEYNTAWIIHLVGPNSDPCRLALAEELIGGLEPYAVIEDEPVIYLAVYKLEGEN